MKPSILIVTIFAVTLMACSQTGRTKLGIDYAKQELDSALHNSSEKLILVDTVIKTQETAVKYAETILFEIYGQKNIESQKPYEIYKIEDYWIIGGTLPKGMRGGTFLIIINSKNGEIIQLTHGK
jgi:hypothetical protein